MDQKVIDEVKGLSREERSAFFNEHKAELFEDALASVNGGILRSTPENPDSECPYKGNWYTSFGYVCKGETIC